MNKVAIYPGTFDPITYGHIDVIKKSLKLFDKIVVGVSDVNNKNYLFNSDERIDIVNKALFKDLKLNKKKILVVSFSSLTTDLCKKYKSNVILRGLRAVSDFEYEFQLAGMNRKLNNNIETIFLMSDVENQIISSKFVKEIVKKALFFDLKLDKKKIIIVSFKSLTTDLCKRYKSNIILRGLRAVSDFEYEFQLAGMNRKLNNNIETLFLMSDVENQIISSKFVKEIIKLGGDIKKFTTKSTIKSLKEKYE